MRKLTTCLFVCFAAFFILQIQALSAYESQQIINWTVKVTQCPAAGSSINNIQLQTTIPTTLHLDLLYHNKIEDPYFGTNWESMKWISQCHATYSAVVQITQKQLDFGVINIVFQGIDTYSTIKVNEFEILRTMNAFVEYKANVKRALKIGKNVIEVAIQSTKAFDNSNQNKNKMPFIYAQTRKACYQYSWDWAPQMNTLGIWKVARIQYYDEVAIDYVWIRLEQLNQDKAVLNFAVKLKNLQNFKDYSQYKAVIQLEGKVLLKFDIIDKDTLLEIQSPKLWWPNGMGKPHMYDFEVKLISGQKEAVIDKKQVPYGIRSVQLDLSGKKFTVMVNGYKVYCKGANYVPPDMLYPRLTNPKYARTETIARLLKDAVNSNFNMIRLWGGGQYESNEFYDLASRVGIMIFYDFMFSDSIYPSTPQFLSNVQRQVIEQVRRVRNYPCLTLWSGNNQILQGIMSWGWGSQKYKNDYQKLFIQHISNIILHQSPSIPYIPSSPIYGVGNGGFNRGGDIHYWGVWAAGSNFTSYETAVGPFNSEFGTQSLPVWETLKQFTNSNGRSYSSPQLLSHERHTSKFGTLRKYMGAYAKESLNFELETYQSGLVQALAIEIAIKSQRASKPQLSWGTLYWQFNDAWPAVSWSSIDYQGRWKPLQYMAKRLFPNVVAYYHHRHGKVFAINDNLHSINCVVQVKVINFDGKVLDSYSEFLQLKQNQVKKLNPFDFKKKELQDNRSSVAVVTHIAYGNTPSQQGLLTTFISPFKQLELPKCDLNVVLNLEANTIQLTALCLLKSVHIYHSEQYLSLQDNYIDVIPGYVHTTELRKDKLQNLKDGIKFRSYRQVYENQQLVVNLQIQSQK